MAKLVNASRVAKQQILDGETKLVKALCNIRHYQHPCRFESCFLHNSRSDERKRNDIPDEIRSMFQKVLRSLAPYNTDKGH